ncbi:putative P-loop containing nucleoside triphosphate hydrolase [Rosellinia necatrix]|uniref:Putative P-loop containing nucleoside triphosphate hydrolase n=1 Tax=Rosellinia necatrix TaxID=77044 RepID=A0A1S7UK30_ROSNE|nr:putative P-loop containing nucleoside triphosphate hydrolase [Rosellinia necatrix]
MAAAAAAAAAVPPNIYVIGSQSTGKTTLVNALVAHFEKAAATEPEARPPGVVKEVAREVLARHSFTRGDIRDSRARALALQRLIVEAQAAAEATQLLLQPDAWFISDRSGVDPVVYARRYAGRAAGDALAGTPAWAALRDRMARSLVVVCEAGGIDWLVDDGVRLMPLDAAEWAQLHAEFCRVLDDAGIAYHVVPAEMQDLGDRVRYVLARWEKKKKKTTQLAAAAEGDDEREHLPREGNGLLN